MKFIGFKYLIFIEIEVPEILYKRLIISKKARKNVNFHRRGFSKQIKIRIIQSILEQYNRGDVKKKKIVDRYYPTIRNLMRIHCVF